MFSVRSFGTISALFNTAPRILKPPPVFLKDNNVYRNPGADKDKATKKFGKHGRGNKGYKARQHRKVPVPGFEGGQTGLLKAFPKVGSTFKHMKNYNLITLKQLGQWIEAKKIDPSKPITLKSLYEAGCIRDVTDGIELDSFGAESLTQKISIQVQRTNIESIKAIEKLGGSVQSVYYHPSDIQVILTPEKFIVKPVEYLLPRARSEIGTFTITIEYYTNPEFRGYLANASDEVVSEIVRNMQ